MTRSGQTLSPTLKHFCNLVPSERWSDLFLVFNPRVRSVSDYQGEFIPPAIVNLMARAAKTFDYVVIATPHHDVAAKDWKDMPWPRMPDPYVLGFQTGLPFAFVLARFSGSGVFPLYHEMVADTIHFLRNSTEQLGSIMQSRFVTWYNSEKPDQDPRSGGIRLVSQIRKALAAFDEGRLFDWIRGEDTVPAKT